MSYFRHHSAIIDDGADIGDGSHVWHFVHIAAGARIGRNVTLGQNVFVADGAVIGDGCKIQNNVSIYEGVVLEDGVFCGPSAVFTNVHNPRARIERKSEYRGRPAQPVTRQSVDAYARCDISQRGRNQPRQTVCPPRVHRLPSSP